MDRALAIVGACAALFAAGCSGSRSQHADGKPPGAHASTGSSQAPPPGSGRVKVRYDDAQTPDAQRGRQLMEDAKLLEDLAQHVKDTLVLPTDMGAVGKQCDQANDFYDPNTNEIQICYESIQHSQQNFAGSGSPDPTTAAVDAETAGFYHELGHATLAIYRLAFTGREEHVADGKPYPNGVRIATNTAQDWKPGAKESRRC